MSEAGPDEVILRRCRSALESLAPTVAARARHWRALSPAVERAILYARQSRSPLAGEVVCLLQNYTAEAPLSLPAVRSLERDGGALLRQVRRQHDADSQELAQALHGTIEQHMAMAAAAISDLQVPITHLAVDLAALTWDRGKPLAAAIKAWWRPETTPVETLVQVEALAQALAAARDALPPTPPIATTSPVRVQHTRAFRIAVIEDEAAWRHDVLEVIDVVRHRLGEEIQIETVCFDNALEARAALLNLSPPGSRHLVAQRALGQPQTIAVVDMGLPADPAHRRQIERGAAAPERRNGQSLLRDLRSYRYNIPCIILTTPPNLLQDALDACAQGIADVDYILKGPDKLAQLAASILRVCHYAQGHHIAIRKTGDPRIVIDGVSIALPEMPFRTLYALCRLCTYSAQVFYTADHIRDELQKIFGEEYRYLRDPVTTWESAQVLAAVRGETGWKAAWNTRAANVMHLWAAAKQRSDGDLAGALNYLADNFYRVWQDGLELLEAYRQAHPTRDPWAGHDRWPLDNQQQAEGFEAVFGGLDYDAGRDYDPANIQKHINEVRVAVHSAFQAVHQYIEPRHVLASGSRREGSGLEVEGYRIWGEIEIETDNIDRERLVDPRARPVTVLIVENDTSYRERIQELLGRVGFEVLSATNVEDAVRLALLVRPDILCLDLHLPVTPVDYERDPFSGTAEGGIQALMQIRRDLTEIKVLIPTMFSDRDDLRERAAALQVPISNFVPKGSVLGGSTWEGQLLLTALRLRQELWTGGILPPAPAWTCPIVRLMPGSDITSGKLLLSVNGRPCQFKGKEGRLAALLLRRCGEKVSCKEIDRAVWTQPVKANTRNQKVNDLRRKIRRGWIPPSVEAERPELQVLESVEDGFILWAHLEGWPGGEERP